MEIIYKQTESDAALHTLGLENCYLKHLSAKADSKITSRKPHHHTGFEIHFMHKGHQNYNIGEKDYMLSDGYILVIPPLVKHCVIPPQVYTSKFSLTFTESMQNLFAGMETAVFLKADAEILHNLNSALKEYKVSSVFSGMIISHRIYESLILLRRALGFPESKSDKKKAYEDDRLTFAKRYIEDNIEFNITVSDVAAHCCLGPKQLTRLFKQYENVTPLAFMQKQKIKHIEDLLINGCSLKGISEKMHFSSEYYFNSFYKKYAGISPGMYKKMHTQTGETLE